MSQPAINTRAFLHAEIDKLPAKSLGAVQSLVKSLKGGLPRRRKASLMTRLKRVKFRGPADFSENLDQYLTGEKELPNLR